MDKREYLPVLDLYQAAYLQLQRVDPTLARQGSRVVFQFPNTPQVIRAMQDYNDNPPVPVLDFVSNLRQLRARMLANR